MNTAKLFEATIIVNWKTGNMRLVKRKSKHVGGFEIPIRLKLTFQVPEFKEIVAQGTVEIPEAKVQEMTIESL